MLSILIMYCSGSQGSVVGIVTRPWAEHLRNYSSTPGRGKISLLENVQQFVGSPSLLCDVYWGLFPLGKVCHI